MLGLKPPASISRARQNTGRGRNFVGARERRRNERSSRVTHSPLPPSHARERRYPPAHDKHVNTMTTRSASGRKKPVMPTLLRWLLHRRNIK